MSLVEIDDHSPNLNLRVFKRGQRRLVLLWNKLKEADGHMLNISATAVLRNDPSFTITADAYKIEENMPDQPGTIICIINESKTKLEDAQKYKLTVRYVDTQVSKSIIVHRAGVLPPHERELPEKNVHSYLWDEKGQTWRKQNGVMGKDSRFYAGVVIIPCPSCGWKGEELTS